MRVKYRSTSSSHFPDGLIILIQYFGVAMAISMHRIPAPFERKKHILAVQSRSLEIRPAAEIPNPDQTSSPLTVNIRADNDSANNYVYKSVIRKIHTILIEMIAFTYYYSALRLISRSSGENIRIRTFPCLPDVPSRSWYNPAPYVTTLHSL